MTNEQSMLGSELSLMGVPGGRRAMSAGGQVVAGDNCCVTGGEPVGVAGGACWRLAGLTNGYKVAPNVLRSAALGLM